MGLKDKERGKAAVAVRRGVGELVREEVERGKGLKREIGPEQMEEIFIRIALGETLISVCEGMGFSRWTLMRRIYGDEGYLRRYHEAKAEQMDSWADYIVEKASDRSMDHQTEYWEKYNKDGEVIAATEKPRSDNTAVLRDRLVTDVMKWIMERLNPMKYGTKYQTEHSGSVGIVPVITVNARGVDGASGVRREVLSEGSKEGEALGVEAGAVAEAVTSDTDESD